MFSATVRSFAMLSSWWMTEMPLSMASLGPLNSVFCPSRRISPSVAVYTPERILISVDLPAPFSPIRACTSPG